MRAVPSTFCLPPTAFCLLLHAAIGSNTAPASYDPSCLGRHHATRIVAGWIIQLFAKCNSTLRPGCTGDAAWNPTPPQEMSITSTGSGTPPSVGWSSEIRPGLT